MMLYAKSTSPNSLLGINFNANQAAKNENILAKIVAKKT